MSKKLKKIKNKIKSKIKKTKGFINRNRKLYFNRFKRLMAMLKRFFREFVFFHIEAFLRVCRFPYFYSKYKKIPQLKNRHIGERCFIIATGPSLDIRDVENLKDEITFSVNSIDRMYDKTEWRPTYYAICDARVYREKLDPDSHVMLKDYCEKEAFISHKIKPNVEGNPYADNVVYIPCCFLDNSFKRDVLRLKFSKNLLWGYYDSSTVVNMCMEITQYMGIKEIYLVGVDCNYGGAKQYFDDRKDANIVDDDLAKRQQDRMMQGYEFMKKELDKLGVKVYNATRGGMLEVFERVDLDEILKGK